MKTLSQTQTFTGAYVVVNDNDSFEELPSCPDCGGLGFIRYAVKIDDPRFGKMFPCENPICPGAQENMKRRLELVTKRSHWGKDYDAMTFKTWRDYVTSEGAWEKKGGAYSAAMAFAQCTGEPFGLRDAAKSVLKYNWDVDNSPRSSLVLTGDVGMGKTGLAVSAVNLIRGRDVPVIFLRVYELIKQIQGTYDKDYDGPKEDDILDVYRNVPVLVIDEFGIKQYTDHRLQLLEEIIRARSRNGLPFMATTNLKLQEFYTKWEKQTADIVAEAHWVTIGGKKLRDTVSREVESF